MCHRIGTIPVRTSSDTDYTVIPATPRPRPALMMTPEAPYSYRYEYSCSSTSDNSAGVPTGTVPVPTPDSTAYRRLPIPPTVRVQLLPTAYRLQYCCLLPPASPSCLLPTAYSTASCLLPPPPASCLLPASCLCYTPHTGANDVLNQQLHPFVRDFFLSFYLSPASCLLPTPDCPRPTAYCLLPASTQRPAYCLHTAYMRCLAILPTSTA